MPNDNYSPCPNYDPEKSGTKMTHIMSMLPLLFNKNSTFSIDTLVKYENHISAEFQFLQFSHPTQGYVYLTLPTTRLSLHETDDKAVKEKECSNYLSCLREVAQCIEQHTNNNARFIFLIGEPTGYGSRHAVTLVIDYDAKSKGLTPTIYDSISRSSIIDGFAAFFAPKARAVMENAVSEHLNNVFPNCPHTKRVAYDHQSRLTSKLCGLFSFKILHHAIKSFSENGIGELSIPQSKSFLNEHSFLSLAQVAELIQSVRESNFTYEQLIAGFNTISYIPNTLQSTISDVEQKKQLELV